ncbi:hypothetical protein HZC00_04940 [Candidatus Kaiserbacteria bacterium]|nr:hypothetical protein [Candidatus Kaiserbacteria bacterium]
MSNIVRLALVSFLQLAFIVAVWVLVTLSHFRAMDSGQLWILILIVGSVLGTIYMLRRGAKLDAWVVALSPVISNEVLSENSFRLSALFSHDAVYVFVVLAIWIGIAVAMKCVFEVISRIAD